MTSFNPKTGDVTYTPNAGFIGNDIFDFHVTDSYNKTSNIGIISISVSNLSNTSSASVSLLDKGFALGDHGDYTQAISYFNKALAIDPKNTTVLDAKGTALYNSSNYKQAILYFNIALAIDPNYTYASDGKQLALSHVASATNNVNTTASSSTNSAAAPPCDPRNSLC